METITKPKFSAYIIPGLAITASKKKLDSTITTNHIKLLVAEFHGIRSFLIDYKDRKREIVKPRQQAHYFAKLLTKDSLATIGLVIGEKDHATVLHSIKTVNNLKDTDAKYRQELELLEKFIYRNI
ncbi:MAG: hypothetical protein JEY96_01630 [Bacteroidales bacterium]|nr:hypothetical protein [Bacteroidales bacterium]